MNISYGLNELAAARQGLELAQRDLNAYCLSWDAQCHQQISSEFANEFLAKLRTLLDRRNSATRKLTQCEMSYLLWQQRMFANRAITNRE